MLKNLVISEGSLFKTASGQPGQGPSFEQQFGILANAQITDKYPSLGKYLVQTQLLDKSDDGSFAVCVVVYKLGNTYIYVPAVFNNGKIRTAEMMEVPSLQRLLPLSDAWMTWVKSKDIGAQGQFIPSELKNLYGDPAATARAKQPVDPLMKTAAIATASVFDTALKLGKRASQKLLDYMVKESGLNACFHFYTPEQVSQFARKAEQLWPQQEEARIVSVMDKEAALLTDQEKKNLYRDGFVVKKDNMVDWGPAQDSIKAVQDKQTRNAFINPDRSCKCKILTQLGDLEQALYLVPDASMDSSVTDNCSWDPGSHALSGITTVKWDFPAKNDFKGLAPQAFIVSNDIARTCKSKPAVLSSSIEDLPASSIGYAVESLQVIPYDSFIITPQRYVIRTGGRLTKDGTTGAFVGFDTSVFITDDQNLKRPLFAGNNVQLPKRCRVLFSEACYDSKGNYKDSTQVRGYPVEPVFVSYFDLGKALDNFDRKFYKKLKVSSDGQEISMVGDKTEPSRRMQTKQAVLHLVKDYGLCPLQAKEIVKRAGAGSITKPVSNSYRLTKSAAQVPQSDMWKPSDIGYSQVPQNPPTITQEDMQGRAQQDARDMQVIQKATESGVKEVFDTQMLKLLVQAADPHEEIQQALPDFMNTLDKLCRLLFIYRCHMKDMQKRYGMIKLHALEQSLQNTIKDLSQLTIFLKLRGLNNGEAPDAGQLQTGTLMN